MFTETLKTYVEIPWNSKALISLQTEPDNHLDDSYILNILQNGDTELTITIYWVEFDSLSFTVVQSMTCISEPNVSVNTAKIILMWKWQWKTI